MNTVQSQFWISFFRKFVPLRLKRTFDSINIQSNYSYSDKPVLLIANHTSWWDGWFAFYISYFELRKKFYFMMLERELNKRKILFKIGGFAVSADKSKAISSLRYVSSLLKVRNNLVLIYPQGKLHSQLTSKFSFQKGVDLLTDNMLSEHEYDIVMMYSVIEHFQNPKPSVYIYIQKFEGVGSPLEDVYQNFASECIHKHQAIEI